VCVCVCVCVCAAMWWCAILLKIHGKAGVISQSPQLQAQITLVILDWCKKSSECGKSCACRSICFCSQSDGVAYVAATITWLRWEDGKICETRTEGFHANWLGLCGCNAAIQWLCSSSCEIRWFFHYLSGVKEVECDVLGRIWEELDYG